MSLLLLFGPGVGGTGCSAITTTGTGGMPVVAGREYVATADFLTAVTSRLTRVGIRWYDAAGAAVTPSNMGALTADSTTVWYQATCFATAPVGAAFASVFVEVIGAAAAEVHYADRIGLMEPSLWSMPD